MAQKQSSQQSVGQLQQGLINQEQKYSLLEKRLSAAEEKSTELEKDCLLKKANLLHWRKE